MLHSSSDWLIRYILMIGLAKAVWESTWHWWSSNYALLGSLKIKVDPRNFSCPSTIGPTSQWSCSSAFVASAIMFSLIILLRNLGICEIKKGLENWHFNGIHDDNKGVTGFANKILIMLTLTLPSRLTLDCSFFWRVWMMSLALGSRSDDDMVNFSSLLLSLSASNLICFFS